MRTPFVFVISSSHDGYLWKLLDSQLRTIAVAPEPLRSPEACRETIELVRGSWVARLQQETAPKLQ
jgi:hypothetical protein